MGPVVVALCFAISALPNASAQGPGKSLTRKHQPIQVRVGVAAPLTGEMAWVGQCAREAVAMTQDEVNNEPAHPVHLEVVFADTRSTATGATTAVKHLIDDDHVSVLLGPMLSSEALATESIAEAAHIPQVFPISASHLITHEGDPWAVRTGIDEWITGDLLADWLLRRDHERRIAVLSLPDAYSSSGAEGLIRGLKRRGVDPVMVDRLKHDSFDPVAKQLKAARAHAIAFFGYPGPALSLLDSLHKHRVKVQMVSGGALAGETFLQEAGARADGVVVASQFSAEDTAPGAQLFTRRYENRFHHEPGNQQALVYDALWLIAAAVEHAVGTTPERLRASLHHIRGLRGATGTHSLNRAGDDVRCPLLLRISGGRFHPMEKGHWGPGDEVRS